MIIIANTKVIIYKAITLVLYSRRWYALLNCWIFLIIQYESGMYTRELYKAQRLDCRVDSYPVERMLYSQCLHSAIWYSNIICHRYTLTVNNLMLVCDWLLMLYWLVYYMCTCRDYNLVVWDRFLCTTGYLIIAVLMNGTGINSTRNLFHHSTTWTHGRLTSSFWENQDIRQVSMLTLNLNVKTSKEITAIITRPKVYYLYYNQKLCHAMAKWIRL